MGSFVILDRDGVINADSADYIKSPEEWQPLPGSLEAISRLKQLGIPVYVATNQAGVARGKFTLETLQQIHHKMYAAVEAAGGLISDLRYCPHHPDDHCACRKPKPGLLLDLASSHNLEMKEGYYVGDSLKDLRAGESAGCTPVLVLTGNGETTRQLRPHHKPVYPDLLAFVASEFL